MQRIKTWFKNLKCLLERHNYGDPYYELVFDPSWETTGVLATQYRYKRCTNCNVYMELSKYKYRHIKFISVPYDEQCKLVTETYELFCKES
jgi:hypothetical protein